MAAPVQTIKREHAMDICSQDTVFLIGIIRRYLSVQAKSQGKENMVFYMDGLLIRLFNESFFNWHLTAFYSNFFFLLLFLETFYLYEYVGYSALK